MSKKFSQFTSQDTVSDNDYINITGATNRRIRWPDFLDNIYDRIVTPFIYPNVVALQEAPLRADEDDPVYVRVEETEYRLYKITNTAPGVDDIVLDNGNTATAQTEYRDVGFVVGPDSSNIGALATYNNTTGTLLAEGPTPSTVGVNLIEFPDSASDGYFRKKNDNTLELLTGSQLKTNLALNNVDNTSDADKPISIATQTELDLKAPLASPALTGTPTAPTAAANTNTDQLATTAFVQGELSDRIQSVATIAYLRLLVPHSVGQVVYLSGHTVAGVGGGTFTAELTGPSVDNNGTVIVVNSTWCWVRTDYGQVTPEMFGAVGDGATDDTVAFSAMTNAILEGSEVRCDGRYLITSQIVSEASRVKWSFGPASSIINGLGVSGIALVWQGSGVTYSTALSDDVPRGAAEIPLANADENIRPGQIVRLYSDALLSDTRNPKVFKSEMLEVVDVSNTGIIVDPIVYDEYLVSDNAQIAVYDPIRELEINGLHIENAIGYLHGGIQVTRSVDLHINKCSAVNGRSGIRVTASVRVNMDDCSAVAVDEDVGYGLWMEHVNVGRFIRPRGNSSRTVVEVSGWSKDIEIIDAQTSVATAERTISVHPGPENVRLIRGDIGGGMIFRGQRLEVDGTRFREKALLTVGEVTGDCTILRSAESLKVRNCAFLGAAETVGKVYITHPCYDAEFVGNTVETPGGDWLQLLSGGRNILIERNNLAACRHVAILGYRASFDLPSVDGVYYSTKIARNWGNISGLLVNSSHIDVADDPDVDWIEDMEVGYNEISGTVAPFVNPGDNKNVRRIKVCNNKWPDADRFFQSQPSSPDFAGLTCWKNEYSDGADDSVSLSNSSGVATYSVRRQSKPPIGTPPIVAAQPGPGHYVRLLGVTADNGFAAALTFEVINSTTDTPATGVPVAFSRIT